MTRDFLGDVPYSSYRKTKIIATVGPATRSPVMIQKLIEAGANVFRLNFSHGKYEEHLAILNTIREKSKELNTPVAILQDLAGPKIRISEVEGDFVTIEDRATIELRASDGKKSTASCVYVEALSPSEVLQTGHQVLLSDGSIVLQAQDVDAQRVVCSIVKGGRLRSRVGIAFPDSQVDLPATTTKDMQDLEWGLKNEVDYVAISFVQNAQDVKRLREAIYKKKGKVGIVAKIERRKALENILEILEVSDGVMVARGDLGLELPLEQLPMVQRRLIELANARGVPVIVATQMLHSMINSVRPTRAEVSDIAAAVMSGADAVMLSEETAIGANPIDSVKYLGRIAREAERSFAFEEFKLRLREADQATVPDSVAYAACAAAVKVDAAAIIACTETGTSARLVAKYRPAQPLYGASRSETTLRRLCLFWGVLPISCSQTSDHTHEIETAMETVQLRENLPNGSRVVVTGGLAVGAPGSTSVLEIRELKYK